MSVIVTTQIVPRLWRGYTAPGLPVGMYVAQASVTGDGTAGNQRLIFNFRTEAGPVSGRFFNLEQFSLRVALGGGGSVNATLNTAGFDTVGRVGMTDRDWMFRMEDGARAGISGLSSDRTPRLPIFLGQADVRPDGFAQLILSVFNIDLSILEGTIQGYIWEPRSVSAEGGLRRPVDSLYG